MKSFVFYRQLNSMDCGPTCLRMIANYYGKNHSPGALREMMGFSRQGVSLLDISDTAEKIGFRTRAVKISFTQLTQVESPCILHWNQNHYVVLVKISKRYIEIADPSREIIKLKPEQFLKYWISSKNDVAEDAGITLLMEPTPAFYDVGENTENKISWGIVWQYLRSSKFQLIQVLVTLSITSILSLIFPFLTQSIVDNGINIGNLQYVIVALIAQLALVFSQTFVNFIQNRVLLKVSNLLNLQVLSDFWIKLTKLPLSYFDTRHTGDTLQRINDHRTIQAFVTGTGITTLFSFINFIIYAIILVIYSGQLFSIFCVSTVLYFSWIKIFLRLRRKINHETFYLSAKENSATLQLVQGMQEIRLNNAEKQKRWEWENIQANKFKLSFRSLRYSQIQSSGATLISQIQGIVISLFVARLVIEGRLTLGAMLAIQYIVGQLSGPVQQWISFIQNFQDAKISMERLNDIHQMQDEEDSTKAYISELPEDKSICIKNLSFSYPGAGNNRVLEQINLIIPQNKVTAIVGSSGSGKTTLIKLLLKVYDQYEGEIRVGVNNLESSKAGLKFDFISHQFWRRNCGSVLQEGFIFNDTIAKNISVGETTINYGRVIQSCELANIHSFIEELPNRYFTKLGAEGIGVSQGQRQRILIARAIYKSPEYIFLDEATNSLDANNEKDILGNLDLFFQGRTVVVIAHRLSTVRNADKIVVLDRGRIVEEGTHSSLIGLKGNYYELVKNQLELEIQ